MAKEEVNERDLDGGQQLVTKWTTRPDRCV